MKTTLSILLLFAYVSVFSQPFNNSWINYGLKYYKFPVVQDGIYRITKADLEGIPTGFSPLNIKIFARGKEIPLYIKNESPDYLFDYDGYIEFYAEKNTGWLDSSLYDLPQNQSNPYYSLINDTIFYFLTVESPTAGLRYQVETDSTCQGCSPQPYCMKTNRYNYTGSYYDLAGGNPFYSPGEGYVGGQFNYNLPPVIQNIPAVNIYQAGPQSAFAFSFSSISNTSHHVTININGQSYDTSYSGNKVIKMNIPVSSQSLPSSSTLTFSVDGNQQDLNALSYISITYPHTYHFENSDYFSFTVPASSGEILLQISNFNSLSDLPVLYDMTSLKKIYVTRSGNYFMAVLPPGTNPRNCLIAAESAIKPVTGLAPVTSGGYFTNYISDEKNADYIIISHPSLWEKAQDYNAYRNLTGFRSALININELYDQYSFGVNKHPLAIRGFLENVVKSWDSVPKYLLLLGKSIHAKFYRNDPSLYAITLVPSMGYPASDLLFSAGLKDTGTFIPAIPTGRIAARNAGHVESYLNKVKEYESNQPAVWMKNVMHFGGGNVEQEQNLFRGFLEKYKDTIEGPFFGANVTSFYKTSSLVIEETQLQLIRDLMYEGTSLMTFFGHASGSTFDQSIEEPGEFNNRRKYPFILANSCLVGDIHQVPGNDYQMSEDWILIPDHGAIGFLASSGDGFAQYLDKFSTEFYSQLTRKNYGNTYGNCINQATKSNMTVFAGDQDIINTNLNFILHGDPAVRVNSFAKPDLTVTPLSFSFNPANVTTEALNFDVRIVINNNGKATTLPFMVKITRTYPDNTSDTYDTIITGCYFQKTLIKKLPVNQIKGVGSNKITVFLDTDGTESYNTVDELDETNNSASKSFNISSAEIFPVYPYEYAIYPDNTVTLKASTGDPLAPVSSYVFELDTTDKFNPPLIISPEISQGGGVVTWAPSIALTKNRVYYWRVSKSGTSKWRESSFIYIPGKTGWSQAHFYQLKKDNYNWILYNDSAKKLEYINTPQGMNCVNIGNPSASEYLNIQFRINGSVNNGLGVVSSCGGSAKIHIAVIDPFTVHCWPSNMSAYGHYNYPMCFNHQNPESCFQFLCNTASLDSIPNLLNAVPDGYYILAYSFVSPNFDLWPPGAFSAFDNLIDSAHPGNPRNLPDNLPWIFFCQKGNHDLQSIRYVVGDHNRDTIRLEATMTNNWYKGDIESTLIGSTNRWDSLTWNSIDINPVPSDSVKLTINGVTNTGNSVPIVTLPKDSSGISLTNIIQASPYPFMKLSLFNMDSTGYTPSQLKKWQVFHGGVPETAVNAQKGYFFQKDTVNEGDPITFSFAFENISPYDMDSLVMRYWIMDKNNLSHTVKQKKLRKHPSGDVIRDTVRFSTMGYPGLNSIWVEANPADSVTGIYYQHEQYHFNNFAHKMIYVNPDKSNPLLDVTFDGVHILDGDIVSAKPEIMIQLKDENKYLALNDSSLFRVYLKSMANNVENRVYFTTSGKENMKFIPAQLPKNSCKIIYNPEFKADGKYQLRVQGKDKSGNESGSNYYSITFEVITKSTITELFNYPNPFSTATRFVFTLTGSELPTDFRIQIITVSGKLARTITLPELGNIHIGRNITEYAWDGKDDFGDKLANGVYFYHVITSINGQSIEKRATEADKYFKHGFGKLYIMR